MKTFSQTTEVERLEVVRLFTETKDNSARAISEKTEITEVAVNKIIDNYLKEKSKWKKS